MGISLHAWLLHLNTHNVLDKHDYINNHQTLFYGNTVGMPAK